MNIDDIKLGQRIVGLTVCWFIHVYRKNTLLIVNKNTYNKIKKIDPFFEEMW